MRLIDADELKEYIDRVDLDTREKIFDLVDRQKTVDAIPVDWLKKYVLIEGAYMSESKRKEREIAKKLLKEYHESLRMEI